jgi:hypothetical protein
MSNSLETQTDTARRPLRWSWILLGLLVFAAVIVQVYRLTRARAVQSEMAALRAQGFPVTVRELQSWRGGIPDKENAAIKIMEAVDYLALENDAFGKNRFPAHAEELGPSERDALREVLTNNVSALEAVHAAAALRQSRFPVDYTRGPNALLPHLAKVKSLTQLLRAEVVLASEEGQPERAVRAVLDSVALARSLDSEPLLISQLVRIACLSLSCSSLERLLTQHALSPEQLTQLADALQAAREASTKSFQSGYLGEICMATFFMSNPMDFISGMSDSGPPPNAMRFTFPIYAWTGLRDRDLLFYLRRMHEMLDAAGQPFPAMLQQSRDVAERANSGLEQSKLLIISRMLLPALQKASDKAVECEGRLRSAEAALAVERWRAQHNGTVPENLAVVAQQGRGGLLADPVDGAPLRFKTLSPGYLVYSVGADGADDGGLDRGHGRSGVRQLRSGGSAESQSEGGKAEKNNRGASGNNADVTFTVDR